MDRLDLGGIPLFGGFTAEAVGFLEGRLKQVALEPGESLATAGSEASSIFIVSQGWVRLVDAAGRELARSGPGSVIGESDALSAQTYTVGASAVTKVRAGELPGEAIRDLVHRYPSTLAALENSLGYRPTVALRGFADWLADVEELSGESPEPLLRLASQLQPLRLSAGQNVLSALKCGLVIVEDGQVEVRQGDGEPETKQGSFVLVDWSLLDGKAPGQSVHAVGDTSAWYLSSEWCGRLRDEGLSILAVRPEAAAQKPDAKEGAAPTGPMATGSSTRAAEAPRAAAPRGATASGRAAQRGPASRASVAASKAAAPTVEAAGAKATRPPEPVPARRAVPAEPIAARRRAAGKGGWLRGLSTGGRLRLLVGALLLLWVVLAGAATLLKVSPAGAAVQPTRDLSQYRATARALTPVALAQAAQPTATWAPSPTPLPTSTPVPTATSTATPVPTDTPVPTETPEPTATTRATQVAQNVPAAQAVPTDTPVPAEPTATPTPSVTYRLASWRQLTPCENQGNHVLMINVVDAAGNGISGVPIIIEWGGESATIYSGDKPDKGPGWAEWPMYGGYTVRIGDGTSDVSPMLTSKLPEDQKCEATNNPVANSFGHYSYEVIFQRAY